MNGSRYDPRGGYAPEQLGVRPAAALSVGFLSQAFTWMFLGLLLSAFVAYLVQNSVGLADTVLNLWLPLIIVEMVIGVGLQAAIRRINATMALGLFLIYAALNGLTFGVIIMAYTVQTGSAATVVEAFVSAAAMFGGAALYGAVTKRSLTNMFGYLAMATWGLLVAILVNMFVGNGTLDIIISIAGVLIFTALTASTVQLISRGQFAAMTGSMEKAAVIGALLLYLEFVNIFLFLLRLFGGGGRS
ncbi:MAG TPA: Bax inhibitor-1/YccA family protein [Candidatus Limnocylindrales bacterium]|jgi:FtsH-binding integral membrane protein